MVNIDFTEENNPNNGIYEQRINVKQEPIEIQQVISGVTSVNGMEGNVVLTAQDVGALPDDTVIPTKTSELENDSNFTTTSDVSTAVGGEATLRENADVGLQSQIDALSVASDVTDVVGTYAALQSYDTSKLKDNDIVKVLQDESQNGETTYYRWSTHTSAFTLIGEEGPYYTKSETDTLLNAKQNELTAGTGIDITSSTISVDTSTIQSKLTAGANITISSENEISATDTTYTAGSNITISDNEISATDTTYSNFVGATSSVAGSAGLVPAPATTDAGKFLKADGTWGSAGGGGPTVVQYIGNSTTSVMSQNATTQMVYQSGAYKNSHIVMGYGATKGGIAGSQIVMGLNAAITSDSGFPVSIGGNSKATGSYDVALGGRSVTSARQEVSVGGSTQVPTRFITNVTDPTQAQDAATKNYVDTKILISDTAPTTSTVGILGQLYTDTSSMHTYQCTDITGGVYTWTQRW